MNPIVPSKSSYIQGATKGISTFEESKVQEMLKAIFGNCVVMDYSNLVPPSTKQIFGAIAQENSGWMLLGNSVCLEIYNRSPEFKINRIVRNLYQHHLPGMRVVEYATPPFEGGNHRNLGEGLVIGGRLSPSKTDNFERASFLEAVCIICALGLELKYEAMG